MSPTAAANPGRRASSLGVDLVAGIGVLPHQVATVAGQQPEPGVDVIELRLDQAEAVDGGPSDCEEVGVVGLVAGIGGEAERLGGQRIDVAGLEAGGDGSGT